MRQSKQQTPKENAVEILEQELNEVRRQRAELNAKEHALAQAILIIKGL